jgi:long-subunit fatty acid transport protein
LLGAAALGTVALASGDAQAGGFAIREQSMVGAGDAFAGEGTTGMGLSRRSPTSSGTSTFRTPTG